MENTCDVVAVNIKTDTVRVLATEKTRGNAEACVSMAVMRRGVDEEFFSLAQQAKYKDGDKWTGRGELPDEEPRDPDHITIGNMTYPRGPRGLSR